MCTHRQNHNNITREFTGARNRINVGSTSSRRRKRLDPWGHESIQHKNLQWSRAKCSLSNLTQGIFMWSFPCPAHFTDPKALLLCEICAFLHSELHKFCWKNLAVHSHTFHCDCMTTLQGFLTRENQMQETLPLLSRSGSII